MDFFEGKKIAIFGDINVRHLQINIAKNVIGKPIEKASNWKQYQDQLVGHDIVIRIFGGNDTCTKDPRVAFESELYDLMKDLRKL